jgi:uncharacterized membrane protein
MAVLFLGLSMFSGGLSVAREAVSSLELIPARYVSLARFVETQTPPDAVFLTATNHNNAVSALAGRKVVCGPSLYLFFHGLDFAGKEQDVRRFYEDPDANLDMIDRYTVSYILVGEYERAQYSTPPGVEAALDGFFRRVWESGGMVLYAVD